MRVLLDWEIIKLTTEAPRHGDTERKEKSLMERMGRIPQIIRVD